MTRRNRGELAAFGKLAAPFMGAAQRWAVRALVAALVGFCSACTRTEPETEPTAPDPWPGDDVRPSLDHSFFADNPLPKLSLYAQRVEGPVEDRPDPSHRGSYGIGNGRIFSLMGLEDPANRLHETIGPVYRFESRYFGDVWFTIEIDDEEIAFDTEWIARPRGTSLVVTRADAGELSLYTVDFAPYPVGVDATDVPPAIVRIFLVRSTADGPRDVVLRAHAAHEPVVEDGVLVEAIAADGLYLGYLPWEGEIEEDEKGRAIALGTIEAGGEGRAVLALATGSTADLHAIEAQIAETTPEGWLADTVSWWEDFSARGLQLSAADPRVEDLYDGMRTGIRVQQSPHGGVSPMSRYTGVWLRDTVGPVRFYARAGLHEEARAALDYLYLCAIERGDYSNACESGLTPEEVGDAPDWEALGPFSGRTAAEGPSHVPLAYREYVAFTGDWAPVVERWSYLKRAVLAQQIDAEGRQGWSGDETFRAAMGAGLGYPIEYDWPGLSWSANSSFLMAGAADFLVQAAEASGHPEDVAALQQRADLARHALSEHFLLPEGHYSPFVFHTAGPANEAGFVETRPFEDVNLQPLWAGMLDPADPVALSNLRGLLEAAGRGDGTIQTPLDPSLDGVLGLDVEEGIATGMVPGYALWSLAVIGDPQAEDAFDALHRYAGPSGQYPEYLVYDDMSALQLVYDEGGSLGDYVARFRPWEGGINLDAMLFYLFGATPFQGGMRLRPHAPNRMPSLSAEHLVAGDGAGSLYLEQEGGSVVARFVSEASAPFSIEMELAVPRDVGPAMLRASGPSGGEREVLPGGEWVVRFEAVQVAPGEELAWRICWTVGC